MQTTSDPPVHSCYEALRWQLIHGQLAPGSRFIEEKWAAQMGVSRSMLREAMTMLAHEGLLTRGRKGGFFVPAVTQQLIDEILEVRRAIEVGALQIVEGLGTVSAAHLKKLRRSCEVMRQLMDDGYEYGFVEADRKFHETLVAMAGNARLMRIYRQAALPMLPLAEPQPEARLANMRRTLADHEEITQRLSEGRVTDAVELLRQHLMVGYHRADTHRLPSPELPQAGSSSAADEPS